MEYTRFEINFVERTLENLENYKGKHEVTDLINNCLGLIIIPRQKFYDSIPDYTFSSEGDKIYGITNKNIEIEENLSLSKTLGHIRNGLAHGRIDQIVKDGKITKLRIHDKHNDSENFAITFSIKEFKEFAIKVSKKLIELNK